MSPRQTACVELLLEKCQKTKKADAAEYSEVFRHIGLLIDGPPGIAGLPFIQSSELVCLIVPRKKRKANEIRFSFRVAAV